MAFHAREETRPAVEGDKQILALGDEAGNGLEIWPGEGFNAYRWHVEHGGMQELLWRSPSLFEDKRPTRSGNAPLFPFPNRIRDARFSWEGKEYRLPATDSNGKNAIHGFVCRLPWRVVDLGANGEAAWARAEFQASKDAPQALALWPSDYVIRLTYRFQGFRVRLDIEVENPDDKTLPFGLGFHPYFSLSGFGREEAVVGVPARRYWPLVDSLPAAAPRQVEGMRDLRDGKACGQLHLDDVLTDVDAAVSEQGMFRFGWIDDWQQRRRLELFGSRSFREIVVFNPKHREAFCIEPYTCVTDAINLAAQGIDSGWRTLTPGEGWQAALELVFHATG